MHEGYERGNVAKGWARAAMKGRAEESHHIRVNVEPMLLCASTLLGEKILILQSMCT